MYWLCYAFNLDADKFSLTVYQQIIKESDFSGQSSDSEDLSALDSSSKCTAVKHANVPKPQKITRSPARISSPHIKDIEKDKHREKHQHSSPRTYKWTFQISKSSIEFNKYHSKAYSKRFVFCVDTGKLNTCWPLCLGDDSAEISSWYLVFVPSDKVIMESTEFM